MSWEHEGAGGKPVLYANTQVFMEHTQPHSMPCHYLNAACVQEYYGGNGTILDGYLDIYNGNDYGAGKACERTKGSGWAASNGGLSGEKCETSECSVLFLSLLSPPTSAWK